jgi:hypothetical protein
MAFFLWASLDPLSDCGILRSGGFIQEGASMSGFRAAGAGMIMAVLLMSSCSYEAVLVEWEDGYIPYYLSGEFSSGEATVIESAMDEWETACGVRFEEVIPRSAAYEIIKTGNSNEWASTIGENNVQNYMYYGSGGGAYSHVLHELGHCVGLLHEHQRPDRDGYVTIVWANIWPEYEYNFYKRNNPLIREEDYAYDYYSVMHYNSRGFSIDGSETIMPIDPDIEITRSEHLTDGDRSKCREIYGDPLK